MWIPDTDTGSLALVGSRFDLNCEFDFGREGLRGRKDTFWNLWEISGVSFCLEPSEYLVSLFRLEAFSSVVFGAELVRGYEL